MGVILGNRLVGFHGFDSIRELASINVLAQIGVLFLLFAAGLESDVGGMVAVGWSSTLVALIGVIVPIILGYFCAVWFFPEHQALSQWFVGAVLCATSVGITARVLADLGRTKSIEGESSSVPPWLTVFGNPSVLGFAGALTAVAVLSKQACALGVLDRGADRMTIGLGMIPRGEVGLIFAGIGSTFTIAGERVIDDAVFSAAVLMVALATLATPPLLAWRLRRTAGT